MPTKRTKRARPQLRRITPEALQAFRDEDELALHRALGLKPWHRSPLDVDLRVKPPTETATGQIAWLETWPQAYMLREALEAALMENRNEH
ncbi:MAG TPA: hypothetical protein VFO82_05760 [Steroidobacteraceae bacterium]|nr:hypothetical protein [Steroidobacteraceae bacterium]HSA69078.1 hypothetical protein [Burkholderiales bacterium]